MKTNAIKLIALPIMMASFLMTGCNKTTSESCLDSSNEPQSSSIEEIKTLSLQVKGDFGQYEEHQVTLLLGDSLIEPPIESFLSKDKLIIGDYVKISYTGDYIIYQTYPSQLRFYGGEVLKVTIQHGDIYEFEMSPNPGGGQSLRPLSNENFNYKYTDYVVNKDGTFTQVYNLPVNTKVYGVNPANYSSKTIEVFYSYNPLEE